MPSQGWSQRLAGQFQQHQNNTPLDNFFIAQAGRQAARGRDGKIPARRDDDGDTDDDAGDGADQRPLHSINDVNRRRR